MHFGLNLGFLDVVYAFHFHLLTFLQTTFPSTVVSFRCPDSAPGAIRPLIGTAVAARFVAPAASVGSNTSAWVVAILKAPAIAFVVSSPPDQDHSIYVITVDCGAIVGYANATCALDSTTGVSLDVSFQCPTLRWTPSCGYAGTHSYIYIPCIVATAMFSLSVMV